MATKKISQFPTVSGWLGAAKIDALQGGVNVTGTMAQAVAYVTNSITTDNITQGASHWFATETGGSTDNLVTLPTIVNLQNQINGIEMDVVDSLNTLTGDVTLSGDGLTVTTQTSNILFSINSTVVVSGTTQFMVKNTAYICTNGSLTTLFLPTSAVAGDIVEISGYGSGLFVIGQGSGQSISLGKNTTTVGTGGSLAVNAGESNSSIRLKCIDSGNTYVTTSVVGNFTAN